MTGELRAYLHARIDECRRELLAGHVFCRACGLPKSPGHTCSTCDSLRELRKREALRLRMVAHPA